jgi:hypothetical protein
MSFNSFLPPVPSGSTSFTLTLAEIIKEAAGILQIGEDGEELEPEDYDRFRRVVNLCVKEIQTQGLTLATYRTGFLFVTQGVVEYTLNGNDRTTNTYYQTCTTAEITAPTDTFEVEDATNIDVDDTLLLLKNDNTFIQSTVVSITPTTAPAANIEIADTITEDIDTEATVINYRTALEPISRILDNGIYRRDFFTTDIPISMISRDEYNRLPFKTTTSGYISQAYFWRARNNGELLLWPPPQDETQIVNFWYESKIDDMINSTDALDLDEFYLPYFVQLCAYRACNRFGVSNELYMRVEKEYLEMKEDTQTYDDEVTMLKVSINQEGM